MEELAEQIEQQKRLKTQADKSKGTLEQEREELQGELLALQAQKAEVEKRRKQAEAVILELRSALEAAEAQIASLNERLERVSPLSWLCDAFLGDDREEEGQKRLEADSWMIFDSQSFLFPDPARVRRGAAPARRVRAAREHSPAQDRLAGGPGERNT